MHRVAFDLFFNIQVEFCINVDMLMETIGKLKHVVEVIPCVEVEEEKTILSEINQFKKENLRRVVDFNPRNKNLTRKRLFSESDV